LGWQAVYVRKRKRFYTPYAGALVAAGFVGGEAAAAPGVLARSPVAPPSPRNPPQPERTDVDKVSGPTSQQAIDMGLTVEDISYKKPQPNALSPAELIEFLDEKVEEHGALKVVPPAYIVTNRITDEIRYQILEQERDRILEEAEDQISKAAHARTEAVIANLAEPHDLYTLVHRTVNDDRQQHWTNAADDLANAMIEEHGGTQS
jgi:hypothetical protein